MPTHHTDSCASVEAEKSRRIAAVHDLVGELLTRLTTPTHSRVHEVEAMLHEQVMRLAVLLVDLWLACQLLPDPADTMRHGAGWYRLGGTSRVPVRTRFGISHVKRPQYVLVHGAGPAVIAPYDRRIGLAAGRMSIGVHVAVASLVAMMPFQAAHEVLSDFCGYAPSTRAMHGIIDKVSPLATAYMEDLAAPGDDGEVLVIEVDHKGVPHMGPDEHQRRRKKRARLPRGASKRERRRVRRLRKERVRKQPGDKSKNARMAALGVVYTLRRLPDGSVEGPVNRRVFGTFQGTRHLFKTLLREAKKRGYGTKETLFLADGELQLWTLQRGFFPLALPCLDWFHLCEYLWTAGRAVHRSKTKAGKKTLDRWVQARKKELRHGNIDDVLDSLRELQTKIGSSGPGTKTRRKSVARAITYIGNHREFMPYEYLLSEGLATGTGNIEGAAKYIGSRLDGSGMRWSKERAANVLALRCVMASDEWDGFAAHVVRTHEQRDEPEVERVTPDKIMTPHKAVKKAA